MNTTFGEMRTEIQKSYDASVLERVQRGMAFLERTHGPGWEDKIDLGTLDLCDGATCVLGQVYAEEANRGRAVDGFRWACSHFRELDYGMDEDLGFNEADDWGGLQAAWVDVLTPRVRRD